jgi:hypothetical protein
MLRTKMVDRSHQNPISSTDFPCVEKLALGELFFLAMFMQPEIGLIAPVLLIG